MQTMTYFDAALKELYLPVIRKQLPEKSVLLSNIKRTSKRIDSSGKYARLTLDTGWTTGIGAKAENATLPTAGYAKPVNSDVYMKYNYARIEISGPVMSAARNNIGAIQNSFTVETQSATTAMRNDINRQLFGDGYGALALVASGSNDNTYTTYTVDSSKYIKKGMYIDSYSAKSGGAIGQSNIVVYDVPSTTTFRVAEGSETVIDNDYIFRSGARDNEMMGLLGIVDGDQTYRDSLQGITRSTTGNSYWDSSLKSTGSSGSPTALTQALMQDTITAAEQEDGEIDFIVTTFALRDTYAALLTPDKRFVNTTSLKGGFKSVDFNDVPLVCDKDAIANQMFFVDSSTLALYVSKDTAWMDDDGSVLSRVSGKDAFEATLRSYQNLGTDRPGKNAVLRFVQ